MESDERTRIALRLQDRRQQARAPHYGPIEPVLKPKRSNASRHVDQRRFPRSKYNAPVLDKRKQPDIRFGPQRMCFKG